MRHPFLTGQIVYLRGLEEKDLDPDGPYFQWLNDQETDRFTSHALFPNSPARMRAFFDRVSQGTGDLVLGIVDIQTDRHVGNIGLHEINWKHRQAKLAILIGEADMRGGGRGSEAVGLVCDHAFQRLNLHRIYLGAREDNEAAIRAYQKAGFEIEGRLKEAFLGGGRYYDVIHMSRINPKI